MADETAGGSPPPQTEAGEAAAPESSDIFHDLRIPAHYEMTLRIEPPTVSYGWFRSDRESKAKLGVRISGFGPVRAGKIWLDFPAGLLDPDNSGTAYSTVHVEGALPHAKPIVGKFNPVPVQSTGLILSPIETLLLWKRIPTPTSDTPQIIGESMTEIGYPITIDLNISSKAPEGDHSINAVLTYLTPGGWKGCKASTNIRVYTWTEKWSNWLEALGVIGAIATVLAVFLVLKP